MTIKVKPLVWEGDGFWSHGPDEGWMEEARTSFGWGYSIEFGRHDEGNFIVDSTFGERLTGFDTPDAAKAAAQADYEARILSAIEAVDPATIMVEALRSVMDRIDATRKIVAAGAETGFNCLDGDWAERLYQNNAELTAALADLRAMMEQDA